MRCLSFVALGAFSVQSIAVDNQPVEDTAGQDPDTQFYEKVRV